LADLQVCGGTFRSRGRKRKRAGAQQDLTWKEKRDRRIENKFGKNGQALGEDERTRMMLEVGQNRSVGGKPRVANSKRGRELRAAAALARFGTNKPEAENDNEEEPGDGSEYEEEYDDVDVKGEDAKDINGQRLLDSMGFGMLRVCGDEHEDGDDTHMKQEMQDLVELGSGRIGQVEPQSPSSEGGRADVELRHRNTDSRRSGQTAKEGAGAESKRNPIYEIPQYRDSPTPSSSSSRTLSSEGNRRGSSTTVEAPTTDSPPAPAVTEPERTESAPASTIDCPICSMANDRFNPTCTVCAHVLDPKKAPRHWRCGSEVCQGSQYVNAGDCGVCGVCGARRGP
jgi:DNA-dependent metalloprotease WSS1